MELDSQISEVGPDGSGLIKLSFVLSNPGVRTVIFRMHDGFFTSSDDKILGLILTSVLELARLCGKLAPTLNCLPGSFVVA